MSVAIVAQTIQEVYLTKNGLHSYAIFWGCPGNGAFRSNHSSNILQKLILRKENKLFFLLWWATKTNQHKVERGPDASLRPWSLNLAIFQFIRIAF